MHLAKILGTNGENTAQYLMAAAWRQTLPRRVGLNKHTAEWLYEACASELKLPEQIIPRKTVVPRLSKPGGLTELTCMAHQYAGSRLWNEAHKETVSAFQPHMRYNYALLLHLLNAKVREGDVSGQRFPALGEKIPDKVWNFWSIKYNIDHNFGNLTRRLAQDRISSAVIEWDNYLKSILDENDYYWMADATLKAIYGNIDSTKDLGDSWGNAEAFSRIVEGIHSNLIANQFDRFRQKLYTKEELLNPKYDDKLREPVKELIVLLAAVTLSTIGDLQAYNSRMALKDTGKSSADDSDLTLVLDDTPPNPVEVESVSSWVDEDEPSPTAADLLREANDHSQRT